MVKLKILVLFNTGNQFGMIIDVIKNRFCASNELTIFLNHEEK